MRKLLKRLANIAVLVTLTVLLMSFLRFQKTEDTPVYQNSFRYLQERFLNPGKEFGSAPLWVWNTKVTKTIIDSMMFEFKKNAFGGVMVHSRPGLITEYLSKDWYNLFQYTVKKGKELGLNVWIYDENSYPTGFAGGLVPEQMPASYNQGQMLRMIKVQTLPAVTDDIFVCLKEDHGSIVDVTGQLNEEAGKAGRYYLFIKEYYKKQAGMVGPAEFPYVDLMVKGVTEKFIDVTFKGYEQVSGNEFGKTVAGIFSDEPSIPAQGTNNVRWTPDLFSVFEQTWGYDLKLNLPALFEETGNWKKIRHDYMASLSQLFIDRWSKPMFEYSAKHNLKWTGHYWEHGWPNPNDVPDNMAMYAWQQQPGIDMLFNHFNETSPNAQFGNIRAVKELASVANQLGKKRTLSESYGGGGWDLTFKDMKRLGDWEYVLGVNFLTQHLSMMTLTGARKYDYPQSFSYHEPWWIYYKSINQYFSRLSFALSHGRQQNQILIIEPTTSAWMYWTHVKKNKNVLEIGARFQTFITTLEKAGTEYDLGSENIIKDHGKIEDGKFVVGERAYTTIVIPPGMENIDQSTFLLLKKYTEGGGKVLQFEKIKNVSGADNNESQNFLNKHANVLQFDKLDNSIITKELSSADFQITGNNPDSIGGNLYHHRRIFNDGQLIFLSNASMETAARGHISLSGKNALLMDLFTGEILNYPERQQQNKIAIDFNIPAAGSLLLFVSDKNQSGFKKYLLAAHQVVVKGDDSTKILRPKENTLMIDFCDLQLGDSLFKDIHVGMATKAAYQHYGFNKNPWDHQVQFKNRIIAQDTFQMGTGFIATYRFTIDKTTDHKKFRAVIEQGALWKTIKINGVQVHPLKDQWWLDRSFAVLDAGKYLKAGENTLSVSVNPMRIFAEIEPVYILGNFNLKSIQKGWQMVLPEPLKLGSWKSQGLPLYGHSVTYVRTYKMENIDRQFEIQLGKWKGTVAVVKVNGKYSGIITSAPNSLNITKYLKKGMNRIEVEVIGSLKNLLGPHHKSPKPGLGTPGQWANIKMHPSGNEYDTYDYGMMEDFQLVKYNYN